MSNSNNTNNSKEINRGKRSFPWGNIILIFVAVLSVAFGILMGMTQLLPPFYLVLLILVLVALTALVAVLVLQKGKGMQTTGMIFGILASLMLIVGCFGVARTLITLNNVVTPNTEEVHVGIYVRDDDSAQMLGDMGEYTFGILESIDRESVDETVAQITGKLERDITISEYASPAALVNALLDGQVDAIVMNEAYVDVLAETEGFEDVEQRLRQITSMTVNPPARPTEPPTTGQPTTQGTTTPATQGGQTVEDPFVVYISGIDSRTGLNTRSRSDVNILAVVNPKTHQILLLSTPRDYFVPLSISHGVKDKLTHAGIYGIDVSIDTLEMLYGIDIDYYFKVHFGGFKDIIDSLGGITVSSPKAFDARGYHFDEGDNYMDGDKALVFARERYSFIDGDFQRGRNQMAVIKAVIAKAMSPSILTNYLSLLKAVEDGFNTTVPYDLLAALVRNQLADNKPWDVITYAVSGYGDYQVTFSQGVEASVVIPDENTVAKAKDLLSKILSGELIEQP